MTKKNQLTDRALRELYRHHRELDAKLFKRIAQQDAQNDVRADYGTIIPAGIVLYEGPSLIDGVTPIVIIATGLDRSSANEKTGPMTQTWILRADIPPHRAVYEGLDGAVCGTGKNACRFAGGNGCYVVTAFGPRAIWGAWKRGVYEVYQPSRHDILFEHTGLRLGSYGDPVAGPYRLWSHLANLAPYRTGYSHQWQDRRFWRFRRLVMASTHSEEENRLAASLGWRTFRAKLPNEPAAVNEIICPASAERGFAKDCASCGACNGAADGIGRRSIVIDIHGSRATTSLAAKTYA